jgi:hypothetical protein
MKASEFWFFDRKFSVEPEKFMEVNGDHEKTAEFHLNSKFLQVF